MKIVNIVCSGSFNQNVKLSSLFSLDSTIFQYDPEMHHAAYLTINKRKIIFYPTGKYIFTGLKNFDEISSQFDEMKLILKPFLTVDQFNIPIVQNIVLTTQIPRLIILADLIKRDNDSCLQYNPTKFPAVIFRTNHGTALIFSNGKIVITGIKSIKAAETIKQEIAERLK